MKRVIDIDENLFIRLFDNGEDGESTLPKEDIITLETLVRKSVRCAEPVYDSIPPEVSEVTDYSGYPVKEKGDCISRKQVLEELMAHQYSQDFCKEHGIEYSINSGMVRIIVNRAPTIEPHIEYGTDGQPYRLYMSGGQVVPDMLQGWKYDEKKGGNIT